MGEIVKFVNNTVGTKDAAKDQAHAWSFCFGKASCYHVYAYVLEREVENMVIKINSKPIVVEDQDAPSTAFDPVYLGVSCLGYFTILCLMDYVCNIFFSVHPLPFIHWIGGVSHWLLTLL